MFGISGGRGVEPPLGTPLIVSNYSAVVGIEYVL